MKVCVALSKLISEHVLKISNKIVWYDSPLTDTQAKLMSLCVLQVESTGTTSDGEEPTSCRYVFNYIHAHDHL